MLCIPAVFGRLRRSEQPIPGTLHRQCQHQTCIVTRICEKIYQLSSPKLVFPKIKFLIVSQRFKYSLTNAKVKHHFPRSPFHKEVNLLKLRRTKNDRACTPQFKVAPSTLIFILPKEHTFSRSLEKKNEQIVLGHTSREFPFLTVLRVSYLYPFLPPLWKLVIFSCNKSCSRLENDNSCCSRSIVFNSASRSSCNDCNAARETDI